jgi:transglutaminase-like putative cysteine protease
MAVNTYYITSASDLPEATTPAGRMARSGGWWTLLLALIMLAAMAEAILAAEWSQGLQVVRAAVMGSAILCFLLALTRWEAPFIILYGFVAGGVWISFWLVRAFFPDATLHDGIQQLVLRNVAWLSALLNGSANADNLVFVAQLAVLSWWLAFFAIWSLYRHQSVAYAAVPVGAALLVNMYFSPMDLRLYLLVFLVSVLLLAVRVELARNESLWQFARIRYAPDISLDFWKSGAFFAMIVLAIAWLAPDISSSVTLERALRPFQEPWRKVTDTWARMYESVSYPSATGVYTTFGRSMTLGGPVALSDRPIFDAQVPVTSYWRAVVYDTYSGQGWDNTDPDVQVVERRQPLGEPGFFMYREITATVMPLEGGQRTIFAPPQPVRVSVPVDADTMPLDEEASQVSVSLMRSRIPFDPGDSYQVTSAVTLAPPDNLRGDSTEYPDWVIERYLQLPETVPQRVFDLAKEYSAGQTNPYDIATAVETRLREYTYNQDIEAPPAGVDGVDYFLFDVKEGYCDYYASAMTVMLRSLGIPARFVGGYTPGQYSEPPMEVPAAVPGTYRVLERNAHAWVEVYFPTYGWIQFEPTASEPILARPESLADLLPQTTVTPPPSDDLSELEDLRNQRDLADLPPLEAPEPALMRWVRDNWLALAALAAIAVAAWVAWRLYRRQQQAFFAASDLLDRLFGLLDRWAARLHIPWLDSATPLERADVFGAKVPDAGPTITRLALLFAAQRYGRQQPQASEMAATAEEWQEIQPMLWKKWASDLANRLTRRQT